LNPGIVLFFFFANLGSVIIEFYPSHRFAVPYSDRLVQFFSQTEATAVLPHRSTSRDQNFTSLTPLKP
jgi:hypothetical protein